MYNIQYRFCYLIRSLSVLLLTQALRELRDNVEEIPCVIGGKKVYTGIMKKQVSVSKFTVCV